MIVQLLSHHFVFTKLATSSTRVKEMCANNTCVYLLKILNLIVLKWKTKMKYMEIYKICVYGVVDESKINLQRQGEFFICMLV